MATRRSMRSWSWPNWRIRYPRPRSHGSCVARGSGSSLAVSRTTRCPSAAGWARVPASSSSPAGCDSRPCGLRRYVVVRGAGLVGEDGATLGSFDEIVCATGFRPDLALTRELRLDLDTGCRGTHGARAADRSQRALVRVGSAAWGRAAEASGADFYTVGMKSYGRAPTFLLLTGYEQVRSVAAAIAGDWDAARRGRAVLPETGVCSTDAGESGAVCCGPESVPSRRRLSLSARCSSCPSLTLAASSLPMASGVTVAETSCCSADEQASCCEPGDKAECCGTVAASTPSGCGCR